METDNVFATKQVSFKCSRGHVFHHMVHGFYTQTLQLYGKRYCLTCLAEALDKLCGTIEEDAEDNASVTTLPEKDNG